jgi:hypothetical protein
MALCSEFDDVGVSGDNDVRVEAKGEVVGGQVCAVGQRDLVVGAAVPGAVEGFAQPLEAVFEDALADQIEQGGRRIVPTLLGPDVERIALVGFEVLETVAG